MKRPILILSAELIKYGLESGEAVMTEDGPVCGGCLLVTKERADEMYCSSVERYIKGGSDAVRRHANEQNRR